MGGLDQEDGTCSGSSVGNWAPSLWCGNGLAVHRLAWVSSTSLEPSVPDTSVRPGHGIG